MIHYVGFLTLFAMAGEKARNGDVCFLPSENALLKENFIQTSQFRNNSPITFATVFRTHLKFRTHFKFFFNSNDDDGNS